jgi:CysZ protein
MNSPLAGFALGALTLGRGMGLILASPRIRRWTIVPFVLGLLVIVTGLSFGISYLAGLLPSLAAIGLGWTGIAAGSWVYGALYWVVLILAWPVSLLALFYFLFLLVRVVAAPFYSFLAEVVLIENGTLKESSFRLGSWLDTSMRMFKVSLVKLVLFTFFGAVLFVLSFLPGLALITGFCFLLMAAFDAVDASFEALQMGFLDRIRYFRANLAVFSGMAVIMGLVFLVPGLNFFLLPSAVVGGADLLHRLDARGDRSQLSHVEFSGLVKGFDAKHDS